jgi:hypothetical protein
MKNFYDLLDINTKTQIKIHLNPIDLPCVSVNINDQNYFDEILSSRKIFSIEVDVLDPIDIRISLKDKDNNDPTTSVDIESISIDGVLIIPKYSHLSTYTNDRNISLTATNLGYNGTWQLKIETPFYQWLHVVSDQGWLLNPGY